MNFFHAFWDWLKEEIWALVEDSRRTEKILRALKSTFLILIPKENGTEDLGKLRPIALCNVIYKIISKVMASCLHPLIPLIIFPEQAKFVEEGRQILEDIILVHEMMHLLKTLKTPSMLLKLDLSKSYDKLNWNFWARILRAFGFLEDWTNWVMNMVLLAFFSFFVNGSPSTPFNASKGIRQRDCFSPFVFIIMVEGNCKNASVPVREF